MFTVSVAHHGHKENRVSVCTELKDRLEADPNFMENIIIGDESWVYGYDLEIKM